MNRKDFFKTLGTGTLVVIVAPSILTDTQVFPQETNDVMNPFTTAIRGEMNGISFDMWETVESFRVRADLGELNPEGRFLMLEMNKQYVWNEIDVMELMHNLSNNFPSNEQLLNEFFKTKIEEIITQYS